MDKEENPIERKVGGNKGIKPSDNKKPFTKDYNGANFEKWTETAVHLIIDRLEDWLLLEYPIYSEDKKTIIGYRDAGNVFYQQFLYKERLYNSWLNYVGKKFSTVSERMVDINAIQEHKLQLLSFEGKGKENITKFILQNKYNWREKTENDNKNDINIKPFNISDIISFDE